MRNSTYFGETKEKIFTVTIEHQQDTFKGKWDNSRAAEHTLTCHGQFNWIHLKTTEALREALEIKKAKYD